MMLSRARLLPCIFVNHGGGPMHMYGGETDPIRNHLLKVGSFFNQETTKPKSILVISAHNEAAPSLRVTSVSQSYIDSEYKAPGDPKLAKRVQDLLEKNDIPCNLDSKPNMDHGALTPLLISFPKADIPVEALSLHKSLSPEMHLKIGEALRPLRQEGVLIIGSGMSFHNLGSMFSSPNMFGNLKGYEFDQSLTETITHPDPVHRNEVLKQWESFPGARKAHPREEHLMPLFVIAGAAGSDVGNQYASFDFMGSAVSGYSFP